MSKATDKDAEVEVLPEFDVFIQDVPGYLSLPEGPQREEGRRIYALASLTSEEGVLAPNYLEEWPIIDRALREGVETIPVKSPRKPGVIKGGMSNA